MTRPLSRDTASHGPGELSFDEWEALRGWLVKVFREIHRLIREIELRAPPLLRSEPMF